ncbi:MAG: non-ribosomal peptide synthase/polyketide synthase [Nostoc sp. DedQUE05]|uniref:non-ribosomal peptide synthase/polyketide synthase n=1 Tax=Nostoc sp. DedQUE05 TaxID=3075391 RepID=UPI002AD59DF1|nr:non-ribosomal peptide synthase/polyketide synthase [Nostoc sp. DedQUE05]MDZ8093916.1 non-ribosomal peptide synthase/polyketide synthase [Nostoc sp. DedQUE05]
MKLELSKTNRQNIEDIYPLSPMQEGMLFESLYAPDSGVYFEQITCILTGNLNVKIFEQAWQQVVARHPVFRTAFLWESLSQPVQVVYRQVNVTVETYNWRDLSTQEQQQQLEIFLDSERQQGFQVSQAPLMRLHLIQLDGNTYQFVWCHHHLLLDGWSSPLVFKDLLDFYQAISHGESLSNIGTVSYRNYISWLQQQNRDLAEKFWRQKFQGFTTPTPLTVDKPLSMREQHSGYGEQQIELTVPATAAVVSFVRQHQLTMSNLVQATWGLLLSRYSQETDVVFGATVSGRPPELAGVESIVGLFINTLPVRVQISEQTELLSLLKDLQAQQIESEQFSYSSLVEIQGLSDVPRGTSLFESIVVFENYPVDADVLQGNKDFSLSNFRWIEQTNYPLTVLVSPGEQLSLRVMYDASRFEDGTISRMLGHFRTMLEAIATNPQQQISQLPILTKSEQQQLLVDWNDTQIDYPQDKCIHKLFEAQVELTPNAVAVVFENQQLTYHELNCRANQLAHYLQSLGVKPDVLVGICVERSLEMLIGILGILKAGGAYVPLDPAYPQDRLRFMLEDAAVSVLLTQQQLVEKLPQHQARVVYLDTDWQLISQLNQDNLIPSVQENNLGYVIYTSGSTGQPKGVAMNQLALCNLILWQLQNSPISPSGVKTLQFAPVSFDVSFQEMFSTWCSGGTLLLIGEELRREPLALLGLLQEQAIERLFVPFVALQQLAEVAVSSELVTSNLREIITAGEQLQITPAISKWLSQLSDCTLHNHYGPSESHVIVTFTLTNSVDTWSLLPPIGRPIANTQIYILDKYLQPVPLGIPGELHIGGVSLARGYLNRPELTEEKFIPNPFSGGRGQGAGSRERERLYKTGDLARYLSDGNIEYLGRIDSQVKIRGFRIELGEIEAVLSQYKHIQASCAIAREDTPGDKRLVAYIVPQPEQTCTERLVPSGAEVSRSTPTVSVLRQFLKSKLPEYMVPSAIVILESLPLTPNGKVDRRALPAPEPSSELLEKYVAPRTPIEEILALIWRQVLKVELVGRHDNFFELGGHSLLATQLISRVRTSLKVELPLRSLFATPTVAELASSIQQLQQQNIELSAPPIFPRAENAEIPLSFAQQRLWFLDQLEPNSALYNIHFGLRLVGTLNVAALEQSLQEIIHRHEPLRTNFVTVDGQAAQIIQTQPNWTVPVVDLQHLSITEQKTAAQKLVQQQGIQPFNLAEETLIRATLVLLSETEHWLLVCMHHVVSDGWSMGVFVQELIALYNAYSQGQRSPLLPLPIQYADFAIWQKQWLQGSVLNSQLSYWQEQLANASTFLPLPTDRPRPAVQTFNGANMEFALSAELTQQLTKLSQEQGVTLFMTLLAAYNTLLYRYTGQTDILVGTPIANRDRAETEGLIGFFVNTLVMRTNLAENPSFSELLPRLREMALSAYAHQDLPFEMLVEALQPERDLSHTPLFQVMFVLNNALMSEIELTGLTVSSLPSESSTAKFDLTLGMENTTTGLVGWWEYNTDLFDSNTIERMTGHLVTLLSSIIANPQQRIDQLPMLTASEQQQLLVEWNNTQVDYPQDKFIHQLFEEQVQRTPDAVAVVFENQQLTYHELNCQANQLAHYLRYLGVGADVLVGICVERSLEMVVGLLGILKAGGAYVPLDPEYPQDRLSFMLEDAQVSVLLSQQHLVEKLPEHQARVVCLDSEWQIIPQSNQHNPITGIQTSNLAYVIYTSGSTGKPKGVLNTHLGICNRLLWMQQAYELTEIDCVLQKTPFSFDVSVWEFFWPLLTGARLVVAKPGGHKDSNYLVKLILEQQVTTLHFVPSMLQIFVEEESIKNCSSLKRVICSGEALPLELQERFFASLKCQLHNLYGPTEAAIDVTFWECQPESNLKTVPIGRPIDNTQIYILDQNLQPVPVGVPGELHIGGAGLARGYLNRPELTQEKFIPNPFEKAGGSTLASLRDRRRTLSNRRQDLTERLALSGAERSRSRAGGSKLYKSGDLARYLPDGNIEYLGRIDNQVKIRGFRIELGEIEAALSQHKDVQTSVVIVCEDIRSDKRIVAYIVPEPQITPTINQLRSFLKEKLPEYMVPSNFVALDSLPLTPNGKIDRRALPVPETSSKLSNKYVAPRTPIEEILAQIWVQVLKVELVGRHDNFFELGGHSLLATQLISRIRTNFQVELPLRSLFAAPTIAELAPNIQRLQQQDLELSAPAILPRANNAELRLSYAQQRLWFIDQLEPNSPSYNIPIGLRLVGILNVAALEQSLIEIIHRHEALRTNFITVDGQAAQIIQTETNWSVTVVELQNLPTIEQEIAAQNLVQQQAIQPFDLLNEALFRATLVILSETEQWLLVCMHHVVSDGWSISVFVQELQALYNAYSQGESSLRDATRSLLPQRGTPLLPLPIQYADFALWQRQWLQGEVLNSQLNYWKQQLANAPTFLPLPTDRPRPAVQTFNGANLEFALSVELTQQLTKLSQEQGVTLFMTLLAAYNTLLYRYTGQTDILVGTPIANRDRTEIEGLIGFFVNTLVMRTEVLGDRSFKELLTHVREMALSAYAHQDLPFEMLVEALQPERDMSHTPLFQVMFVLQNTPMSEIELTGLTVSSLPIESSTAKFDLTLIMENTATGLVGWWEYNTDLFNSSTIERMTGHFVTMLEAIVANPQERISKLPILTESEQRQLLVEWNDTWVDYPQDKCIHQLFEEQCLSTPDAVAVVFENQQLTYHELNCRANQLAHYLRSLGVGADVLVGICVERSLEMLVGILGILKAGGVYVPLDPEYPEERLNFMLEDAQVSLLLTQEKLVESLVQHQVRLVSLDSNWQSISLANQDNFNSTVSPENLCYVIYTSGSTGTPKGVAVTHQAVNRLVFNTNYVQLSPSDRVAQAANIAFDAATFEIWGALLHGAKLVIINKSVLLTPKEFAANMRYHEVSVLFLTTALFNQLANFVPQAFSSLRYLLFGGEAVDPRWVQEVLEKGAPQQLLHVYGPTENTTFSSWYLVENLPTTATTIPIGRPISNTQIYIFDQNLQPVPVGVPGELYIGGVGLAQGYFNAKELTQEKFIPNPFSGRRGGERLYKTGDLARYLPDGNIEYLVRIDNQVKIRGFRIELGEIEAVLSQHEDVQVCCVIAREDMRGDKRLVAYIVPQPQMTPKISVLRSFLKEKLSEYMIPSAFVILEFLPLTPNGKIDRRALPAPETSSELSEKYVAPRSPIEEILSLIWTQVLKVELVGRHDNFFELGGHSLLATQLISRIRTNFQVEIPLRSLFAAPTIAQLALNIQRLQQQDLELSAPPILSRAENVEIPLSYAQQRLWFLDQLEPNSASYNIPIGLRLVGTLEVTALEQSLIEIIHRHEALRTNFITVDGQAAQIIQTPPNWTFSVVDLQHLSTTEIELAAQQLVQQQAIQPFDLAEQALFRAKLLVLSPTEQWLLVCMHHVVSDGWSIGVFVQELQALYNAYSQGQPSPLLPLPIQYADFAIWQKQWLQGSVLNSQLSYWQEQLANASTFLPLPTDRPRPAVQTFNGANMEFALSAELTQQLTKLSQEQGVTLFMTLLAAYNTLLYRYTGQTDILVGTPIANRDRTEIEGLIGFFVNTLVMRTDLSENPSFNELLPRLREMALSAYAHQDLPFEMLVETLQPERDMSHTPLFQVMFVLQNTPMSEIELTGLTVSSLPIESSTAKFDLTLSMENTPTGLVGVWEYNTNLFDSCTIERMTGNFVTLLEGIVANPSERISQLPMLTASEQQQLLIEWNDTQTDYPIDKCIHQLFEEQVQRTPDAVAVVFENQQLTYHELNSRANQLAHYLQSLGVRPDTLVAICVERSLEMVVGLLGILKAGAAYVPLDPAYPQDRLSFMLENAQASVLLTQQQLVEKFQKNQAQVVCLDTDWHFISQLNRDNLITEVQATNLAYVIYTSGSTGTPKGVLIAHQGLLNLVLWHQRTFKITTLDKATQLAGTGFDAAAWELWPYLTAGASIYLVKSDILASPVNLRDWLISQKITISFVPTPVTQELLSLEWTTESLALRYILTGGDKLNQYPPASVPFQVVNNYGPTENTVVTTSGLVVAKDQEQISPSIGRPIDNTHIYILDKYLQPVPIGVPGELHIGGAGLARGYLNRPELTQEKFIPNPFEKAEGSKLYKTGDLARYLPDGNIEYLGRIDNQIKIRGFRIELGEIEAILSQHPGVRENTVVAREDIPGEKRLVAYFVPQLEQTPTINELRIFLKEKLPQYMVPSAFVRLEFLPLTPNGKVDRKALPIPDSHNTQAVSFVAPRTSVEKVLADIWANVLHLKQVGVLDNFFELGGHSLSTIRVMSQVNETFQIKLPLRHLFTAPTVAELAQTIEFASEVDSNVTANKITTVDLQAEVVLDQTINRGNLVYQPVSEPWAIFLTGATGFVGAFLLAELLQQTQADIYCLVRAANVTAGKQRLQETLKSYLLWEASFNSRIIPVLGDLSQPLLGLSDEQFHLMAGKIDSIYHNGALVNHVYPYALLKAANIRGTEEVLRLASQIKIKPVHFISTVSVFASDEYFKLEVVQENDPLESCQGLPGGYAQSKWVAEKMVMMARDRGLPCSIYRLGRITWHSQTGVWNLNDMFYRFIKSCIQLKSAPEMNSMVEITPVDYLTKALIHLSQQPESLGKAFHLINSDSTPWSQFIDCIRSLGYPLQQLSYEDWQAELLRSTQISTDNALYSVVSLAGDNTSSESNATSSLKFDCQNTLNGLADTDIRWPEVDEKLLQAFFANFTNLQLFSGK